MGYEGKTLLNVIGSLVRRHQCAHINFFSWKDMHEFAISNHYDRHCVWEEVAQNKKLNKYNHTVIDEQFAFYRADGLEKFDASDPNKLLPSSMFC